MWWTVKWFCSGYWREFNRLIRSTPPIFSVLFWHSSWIVSIQHRLQGGGSPHSRQEYNPFLNVLLWGQVGHNSCVEAMNTKFSKLILTHVWNWNWKQILLQWKLFVVSIRPKKVYFHFLNGKGNRTVKIIFLLSTDPASLKIQLNRRRKRESRRIMKTNTKRTKR